MAKYLFKECVAVKLFSVTFSKDEDTGNVRVLVRLTAEDEDGIELPVDSIRKHVVTPIAWADFDLQTHGATVQAKIMEFVREKNLELADVVIP